MDLEEHLQGIADCARVVAVKQVSRVKVDEIEEPENDLPEQEVEKSFSVNIDIAKATDEEQTVTGIVLQPEIVDGQGDIMSIDVIKDAAYKFLSNFNQSTKLGIQHNKFPVGKMALVESYLAPMDFALGSKTVRQGSWIMTMKILDSALWQRVKDGKITGFSIGGKATVVDVKE